MSENFVTLSWYVKLVAAHYRPLTIRYIKSILPMRLVFCPPENKKINSLIRQWLMLLQMNTYLKAIARNGHLFKGKVCLDVGCGLGVRVSSNLNLFPPTSSYLI